MAQTTVPTRSLLAESRYKTHPIKEVINAPYAAKHLDLATDPDWRTFSHQIPGHSTTQPMQVYGLNHFNITAPSAVIEQLKRFYVDIIGLTIGPRARLDHEGYWLYAGNSPVLHLSAREQCNCQQRNLSKEQTNKQQEIHGCFDHISLSCAGLAATIEKMRANRVPYKIAEILGDDSIQPQIQLLIEDPVGVRIELNFSTERIQKGIQ